MSDRDTAYRMKLKKKFERKEMEKETKKWLEEVTSKMAQKIEWCYGTEKYETAPSGEAYIPLPSWFKRS